MSTSDSFMIEDKHTTVGSIQSATAVASKPVHVNIGRLSSLKNPVESLHKL